MTHEFTEDDWAGDRCTCHDCIYYRRHMRTPEEGWEEYEYYVELERQEQIEEMWRVHVR